MINHFIHKSRPAILGIIALIALVASLPFIVAAQDASPEPAQASPEGMVSVGDRIFTTVCIACHQPDGKGIPGIYLPLDGNPAVTLDDPTYIITTVLNGRGGMPRFDGTYSDEEIAAIVTYVRQSWSNDAPAVTAEEVATIRKQYETSAQQTPEGQIPEGSGLASPEASPEASPGT